MNMIDLILIVMGWLAIVSINGGHRDHEHRIKRLERQQPTKWQDCDKMSEREPDKGVEIEES